MFFAHNSIKYPTSILEYFCEAQFKTAGGPSENQIHEKGKLLKDLWPLLAKDRGKAKGNSHYSFSHPQMDAYASYYLIANALKPSFVLEEAFLLDQDITQEKSVWLDIGMGPGTAFWGLAWWHQQRGKKLEYIGWDQSALFVDKAKQLVGASKFAQSATFLKAEKAKDEIIQLIKKYKPTHVSFMNSVAEIYPDMESRKQAMASIWQELSKLGPNRKLIVIEPGSKDSSRELAEIKGTLAKCKILFPCTDSRPCGALASPQDWCHEEVFIEYPAWLNEIGSQAGLKKESMLFSYIVITPEALAPAQPSGISRMVSQRMEQKGQITCHFCTLNGKIKLRVQNSKINADNAFIEQIGRGDLFLDVKYGEKGDIAFAEPLVAKGTTVF